MAAWRGFVETYADLISAIEFDLVGADMSLGDYQVLVFLSEADQHSVRMCDLAEMLQLSPSGLTRRLDGLVRAGLVARHASDTDRRVMLAVLTRQGIARLEDTAPVHVASVRRRMVDLLDRQELHAVATAFGKIRAALDAEATA